MSNELPDYQSSNECPKCRSMSFDLQYVRGFISCWPGGAIVTDIGRHDAVNALVYVCNRCSHTFAQKPADESPEPF